jgi:hypothetical protein
VEDWIRPWKDLGLRSPDPSAWARDDQRLSFRARRCAVGRCGRYRQKAEERQFPGPRSTAAGHNGRDINYIAISPLNRSLAAAAPCQADLAAGWFEAGLEHG